VDLFRVACESPRDLALTRTILTDTSSNRHWDGRLGDAVSNVTYPRNTWLSPMNRGESFFHLTFQDANQPGSEWQVPAEVLDHCRIEIEPQPLTGKTVVAYELPNIVLSRFAVTPAR
jgi:hypothetical protein